MSEGARPSGRPVNPPMPNIGRNASAKSIGVVNRIDAPQSDSKSAVKITTDGIEMIIVVTWKNELIVVPMPVMNMWWAHTMNDIRNQVNPFALSCTMVTMKFTEPRSDEVIRNTMPNSQSVWPLPIE